jgi:hypothetical protein
LAVRITIGVLQVGHIGVLFAEEFAATLALEGAGAPF